MWTQSVLGVILYVHIVYIILYVENFTENIVYPLLYALCTVHVVYVNARYKMRVGIYYIYNIIRRRFYGKYCTLRAVYVGSVRFYTVFLLYIYYYTYKLYVEETAAKSLLRAAQCSWRCRGCWWKGYGSCYI